VDINIAVNTENGLYVPLIRNVERLGLTQISSTVKELAEKAKQNKLSPSEVEVP
jgi:pyruvate dehydrogenase E2 component (dihydrolipoamide acetyltransferase)